MLGKQDRNCQIRMSPTLWNQIGELARELGHKDPRGRHSVVIREFVGSAAAIWRNSPYICRAADHTVYVSKTGDIFSRQVQVLRLNSPRHKLPSSLEMKPEKREYYHKLYQVRRALNRDTTPSPDGGPPDEFRWFLSRWLLNHFAVWSSKKDPDDLEAFQQEPLSSHVDTFGTTYKSADLAVDAVGGRSLTREVIVGLRDYVQWKDSNKPVFDRVDIPIDIPTAYLQVSVVVDQDLFSAMDVEEDEIADLALEFRNRESARFEGKEVALSSAIGIEELSGRSAGRTVDDEGADEMLHKIRRLRQRVTAILESPVLSRKHNDGQAERAEVLKAVALPQQFLFYRLRWPFPHLGIEACVRWEKPPKPEG